MSSVTFVQLEEMVEALPAHDQQRLIQGIGERLATRQDYFARAETFIKTCLENPIRPAYGMDSGNEIAEMRDERGNKLL